jgi:hypothetical protein
MGDVVGIGCGRLPRMRVRKGCGARCFIVFFSHFLTFIGGANQID